MAAGAGMAATRLGRGVAVAGVAATAWSAARIAVASRQPPIAGPADPDRPVADPSAADLRSRPTFTVLVGARDEAPVIGGLVADVAAQDHRGHDGEPRFELVIVDDRSLDGTGDVALAAARAAGIERVTRVIPRTGDGLADGKGAALTAAPASVCRGDVVVVLDADARIGPTFLSTLARYSVAGQAAVTARRRVVGAGRRHLFGAQADEQTVDGEIQRGRWALGGCSEFRGNGIVVDRELLASVGDWRAEALTEDLDLSSRIAARCGVTVAWAIDAEVWEEPVTTWTDLWRQRVRWAEGALRRLFEHGPAVVTSPRLTLAARLDFVTYAGQLLAPPLIAGAVLAAPVAGGSAAGILLAGYAGSAAVLGWDALRWERDRAGRPLASAERLARAVRVALFGIIWLAAVPAALWRLAARRGPVRYDKMAHGAVVDRPADD